MEEFKRLVTEKKPGSIVYILEQNGFAADKEVTILRLIMLHGKRYYIFIDAPKGDTLRETGIPLRKDKRGTRFLDQDEVKSYLKNSSKMKNWKSTHSGPPNCRQRSAFSSESAYASATQASPAKASAAPQTGDQSPLPTPRLNLCRKGLWLQLSQLQSGCCCL